MGRTEGEGLGGLGRLSEPALLIMVSLAGGPKHGYAIMEDVERLQHVRLGPGTLYGALMRLEERGMVEPLPVDDRRKPYRLTAEGAAALNEQLRVLEQFASVGLRRLSQSGAESR